METTTTTAPMPTDTPIKIHSRSVWSDAWDRLKKDRLAMVSLAVIIVYALVAILSAVGILAADWDQKVGDSYMAPSFKDASLLLGTDIFGYSVLRKIIHGTQIAMSVGLVSSVIATIIGIILVFNTSLSFFEE